MDNVAIRVAGISKLFRIGVSRERYRTFRDTLTASFVAPFRRAAGLLQGNPMAATNLSETFWALKDISFNIQHGEVVGVIGRNGAGKSTLLKVLSRITEPTTGRIELYGRVGALLEVGTGFHPELTGRENIYLNGAILGMSRREIDSKFDEIVAFAEVEKFIETPVKHYSSGMGLRLGFAVAAHLEPEILVVDEVLAVGDLNFQRKCLGKMNDVAKQGRTVLFVSHNLAAIRELCQTSIVLDQGKIAFRGLVTEGLALYTQQILPNVARVENNRVGWQRLKAQGQEAGILRTSTDEGLTLDAWFLANESIRRGFFYCIMENAIGDKILHQRLESKEIMGSEIQPGLYHFTVKLPPLWLAPGLYTLHLKFLETDTDTRYRRFLSENVIVDMYSPVPSVLEGAMLAPIPSWKVDLEQVEQVN